MKRTTEELKILNGKNKLARRKGYVTPFLLRTFTNRMEYYERGIFEFMKDEYVKTSIRPEMPNDETIPPEGKFLIGMALDEFIEFYDIMATEYLRKSEINAENGAKGGKTPRNYLRSPK